MNNDTNNPQEKPMDQMLMGDKSVYICPKISKLDISTTVCGGMPAEVLESNGGVYGS